MWLFVRKATAKPGAVPLCIAFLVLRPRIDPKAFRLPRMRSLNLEKFPRQTTLIFLFISRSFGKPCLHFVRQRLLKHPFRGL